MSVIKLKDNEIRKDGRAFVFRVSEYGIDGKKRWYLFISSFNRELGI